MKVLAILFQIVLVALAAASVRAGDFPNVLQVPGTLLNGPIAPEQGRTAIICWHGGRIISVPEPAGSQDGADLRVRIVNISDPVNPQITVMPYQAGGFISHAYFHYGPYLYIGPHAAGPNLYRDGLFISAPGVLSEASLENDGGIPIGTYNRSGAQSPWGAQQYSSYDGITGDAYLAIRRSLAEYTLDFSSGRGEPIGPAVKSHFDLLGRTGIVGMPFIMGNILIYASEQSGTGVATYDISDPANPILLDVLKSGNPGGYFPEIYGHYIFFPRRDGEGGPQSQAGYMVVDFQDPANLRIVANRNIPGSNQYVTFQDEYAFMNRYKIDMRTFDIVLTLPTNGVTLDASQFALPVGNLVVTGGYGGTGPGLAIWAHQAEPDTRGPFVAYHVPAADQTNYSRVCPITLSIPETLRTETIVSGSTLIVRPVGGAPVPCWHSFGQNKLLTVTPIAPLDANTTYEVLLTSGIQDAAGNGMEPYSFRFSTGSGVAGGNRAPTTTALDATPVPAMIGAQVDFTATASDPEGDAIEYRFDFGDGSPKTAWSTANAASHTFSAARHYQVTVQVRDGSGALSSFLRAITVAAPLAGVRPVNSSPIVLDAAARRVYTVNPDSNTLTAVHADTLVKIWEQPTGADPRSVALASDGTLWVACHGADRMDILDANSGALLASLATGYGSAPLAVCASPDGATIYAACSGNGTFRSFAVGSRSAASTLAVGALPRAIALTGDGARALVTRFISEEHEGSVYDVNLADMTLTRTIRLGRIFTQDGSSSGRGVPNYLAGITITPDNANAWVVGKKDNTERGTFTSANLPLGQDSTVRAQLLVIDLATNLENLALRMDIDNSESPTAIAFSPLGDYAFIALQGNNQVAIVDQLEFMRADSAKGVMARVNTGLAPQGLALDASSGRMFTQNFMGRSVSVVEFSPLFGSGSLNLPSTAVPTVTTELLSAAALNGKRIFYNGADPRMSAEGYISCAACHADGGHDGRTFDFTQRGEGFRNTTDLRGRSGTGHGAVHWTANFDEIQDFENDMRNAFGGTGFMTDADFAATSATLGTPKAGRSRELDDLAAYVASLDARSIPRSPQRQADGGLSASAQAGRVVFMRENCAGCHIPEQGFTDRRRHNVGTLRASSGQRMGGTLDGIDTPSLLGVHAGAPYFHDGSAKTLADVFTIAGGDLRQAESGVVGNGAVAGDIDYQPMKHWHGGGLVSFLATNQEVTFNTVDGGPGGMGMLEIRYAANFGNGNVLVIVNGVALPAVSLPLTPNEPNFMSNEWRSVRVFNVPFAAGTANTVTVRRSGGGQIRVDDVLFSTPAIDELARAHRRNLSPGDLTALIDYIEEIDGNDAPIAPAAPAVTSLVATPNPARPGVLVSFTADAVGSGALQFSWTFGDGATGVGPTPVHSYAALGVYTASVTVTDATGQVTVAALDVLVSAEPAPGGGPGNGPGGNEPGGPDGPGPGGGGPGTGPGGNGPGDGADEEGGVLNFTVTKLQGRVKFGSDRDQCVVAGTIPDVATPFNPNGQSLLVNVGGASLSVTLDSKGRAKTAGGTVTLKLKRVKKNAQPVRTDADSENVAFTALLKGSWSAAWLASGVIVEGDAQKESVAVPVTVELNGRTYTVAVPAVYTGKQDKSGTFKN